MLLRILSPLWLSSSALRPQLAPSIYPVNLLPLHLFYAYPILYLRLALAVLHYLLEPGLSLLCCCALCPPVRSCLRRPHCSGGNLLVELIAIGFSSYFPRFVYLGNSLLNILSFY